MYRFLTIPKGTDTKIFARGPWLFLQYDFLIISLSGLSWAILLLRQTTLAQRFCRGVLGLIVFIRNVTIGSVSLALLVRGSQLSLGAEYTYKSR